MKEADQTTGAAEEDDALGLYGLAIARGWQPEGFRQALGLSEQRLERAVKLLLEMNLLRHAADAGDGLVAVSPDIALADTVGPLKRASAEADELVVQASTRNNMFRPVYFGARRERNHDEAIDRLSSPTEIDAVLAEQVRSSRQEILFVQPYSAAQGDDAIAGLGAALRTARPQVGVRMMVPHTARLNTTVRQTLHRIQATGVGVRTTGEVASGTVVIDRQTALLADNTEVADGPLVVLREPTVVAHLSRLLESQWLSAADLGAAVDDDPVLDDHLKSSIVRLLGEGLKDEVVARRLGMSVRSCRRHIAEVTARLGASSRFQAGALAQRAGLLG